MGRKPRAHVTAAASSWVRGGLLWLSRRQSLQRMAADFGPARRVARRFVAGETRDQAIAVAAALKRQGFHTTVAHLGEHSRRSDEAVAAADECVLLLRALAAAGLEPNISIKLTQLGWMLDPGLAEAQTRRIVAAADDLHGFVRIDMESSAMAGATLELYRRLIAGREPPYRVGIVLQAYLRRAEQDARIWAAAGAPIRLVKGAYAEPATVAFPDKVDVDAAYRRLAAVLLSVEARRAGGHPAFATHDAAIIAAVRRMAADVGATNEAFEFQMLLGVRRDLQRALARQGLAVRVYVPYGHDWYPYFMRRLAERPGNVLFLARSVMRF